VLRDPPALLNDHAYLEKNAAVNALDLLVRWPNGRDSRDWMLALTSVARDEAAHLDAVARALKSRGGAMEKTHENPYASALRRLVRRGRGREELTDLLLVSALIEARSCERFGVLARAGADAELTELYSSLHASEMGHHILFLNLASVAASSEAVAARWDRLLDAEAEVLAAQAAGPRLHSGA
jgi:tRNA 2-(methylsulfanyl)-N6-isopentenyladenosine37 hydroxylase